MRKPCDPWRLLTLKEAFIKATSEGLSRSLATFSFSFDPVAIAIAPGDAGNAAQWRFFELKPTPSHLLALAIRTGGARIQLSICPFRTPS